MSVGTTSGDTDGHRVSGKAHEHANTPSSGTHARASGCLHQRADALFHLRQSLQDLLDFNLIKFQTQKFRFL